jgi:ABC-type multidrug transport system fused ATPase/permease subunit
LEEACQNAGIMSFIKSLPNGFSTVLSESAENVSGGQRQRLAIARAFYKDAPFVLFDEATSALDPITEGEILETVGRLTEGRTILAVAHRKKVIESCDRVIVMDAGKVVGIGTHAELIKDNAVYSALYDVIAENGNEGMGA